jgi:hypothetical protein
MVERSLHAPIPESRYPGLLPPSGLAKGIEGPIGFEWLDRAYAQRDPGVLFVSNDALFECLREDARYHAFLKKMRLPS